MDIPAGLLPGSYLWSAAVLYALFLCLALVTATWSKVVDNEASHVYFGAIFMLILLCLMFEWQFALFAVSIVLVVTTWQGSPAHLSSSRPVCIRLTPLAVTFC